MQARWRHQAALATGRTQRRVYWQDGYFNRRARAWNGSADVVLFALVHAALFCFRFLMHLDMKLSVMSAQIDVNTHPAMTMG